MTPAVLYRLQLHGDFTFDDAADVVPYLARLGVSHMYCSPYLQAARGSQHGYDVVDHRHVNAELGGDEGHRRLLMALKKHGMGQVLDIVPNHMAASPYENRWWWDVLANGPASVFAEYFDIDWDGPAGKSAATVLVPILGDQYGRELDAGKIVVERSGALFSVRYYEHELPIALPTLSPLFEAVAEHLGIARLTALARICALLDDAGEVPSPAARSRRQRAQQDVNGQLMALLRELPAVADRLDIEIAALNRSPERLDRLLRGQWYRLAFWRVASEELDYRRFFNIETLVALRAENPAVFEDSHRLVLELVRDGVIDGLRIDHVDGLRDPAGYLTRLSQASGGVYTVVEKILEDSEALPDWPVAGTTGYEFLNRVNSLFVSQAHEAAMSACYCEFTGESERFEDLVYRAKREMMEGELRAEIGKLTGMLAAICEEERRFRDFTRRELREVLIEFVAAFPVYRTYAQPGKALRPEDAVYMEQALSAVFERSPDLDRELLSFIGELSLLRHPVHGQTWAGQEFATRLSQLTAPVMAKGVEDTAFYRYHRLISLNEVGGHPGQFGQSLEHFHAQMSAAAERWPHALLTLSTHDTKRSADVRARINGLSEVPQAYREAVFAFAAHNKRHRAAGLPDSNLEYLIYQTLIGAWPLSVERMLAFVRKAMREAKVHTSWLDPDESYERAAEHFVRAIMEDSDFVSMVEAFLTEGRIIERGRLNSLAQMALLLTCPGVPDIYQGTELWDLSLVDPDNRRPVAFARREQVLEKLHTENLPELVHDELGMNKMWLVSQVLRLRQSHAADFADGGYETLVTSGPLADRVVAFRRGRVAVVVPRLGITLQGVQSALTVTLPAGGLRNVLSGQSLSGGETTLADLLSAFPIAVLVQEDSHAAV